MDIKTKNNIKTICMSAIIVLVLFGFFSAMVSTLSHLETDNIIINGNNIDSYTVTDDGMINIIMKNGTKYIIDLSSDDDIVDFTVNSDIYIELYRLDINFWWWEGTKFSENYYLERIIKLPDIDGGE